MMARPIRPTTTIRIERQRNGAIHIHGKTAVLQRFRRGVWELCQIDLTLALSHVIDDAAQPGYPRIEVHPSTAPKIDPLLALFAVDEKIDDVTPTLPEGRSVFATKSGRVALTGKGSIYDDANGWIDPSFTPNEADGLAHALSEAASIARAQNGGG